MVERGGRLSLRRQSELLGLSRSSLYYTPRGASAEDLAPMRRLDELYLAVNGVVMVLGTVRINDREPDVGPHLRARSLLPWLASAQLSPRFRVPGRSPSSRRASRGRHPWHRPSVDLRLRLPPWSLVIRFHR